VLGAVAVAALLPAHRATPDARQDGHTDRKRDDGGPGWATLGHAVDSRTEAKISKSTPGERSQVRRRATAKCSGADTGGVWVTASLAGLRPRTIPPAPGAERIACAKLTVHDLELAGTAGACRRVER
jgi:hypothetical protein